MVKISLQVVPNRTHVYSMSIFPGTERVSNSAGGSGMLTAAEHLKNSVLL